MENENILLILSLMVIQDFNLLQKNFLKLKKLTLTNYSY